MLTTGNQLKAARALIDMDQATLAERAGVNVNTIRNMEEQGAAVFMSGVDTARRVQQVLEGAGIEFLNDGRPGVRLKGNSAWSER
jgi:DNA-binding XRE family transcriptional regulator